MYEILILCFFLKPKEKPFLAVLPFANASSIESFEQDRRGKESVLSHILTEALTTQLRATVGQKMTLVERNRINAALKNRGSILSKEISLEECVEIGQFLGAGFLLTGTIVDYTKNKRTHKFYKTTRKVVEHKLSIVYRVIDIESSRIVFSKKASGLAHDFREKCIEKVVLQASGDIYNWLNSQSGSVAVKSSQSASMLKSEKIKLKFESIPSRAEVEINGIFCGNTPLDYEVLSESRAEIIISKPGYKPWIKTVLFHKNLKIKPELEKK